MRSPSFVCVVPLLAAFAACGPNGPSLPPPDDAAPDVAADAPAADAALDVTATPDATPDVTVRPDAAVGPDAAPDVTARPDAAADAPSPLDAAPDAAGAVCGTRGAGPCPAGTFCNHPVAAACGETDRPGACEPVPTACNRILMPVCGCDGMTYSNPCLAAAARVSVRSTGECPGRVDAGADAAPDAAGRACGTRGTGPCPAGMFCNHPLAAACGEFDAPGACAAVPEVCTREYVPVCGCDGMTYSNACAAAAASVSVRASGACASRDAGADAAPDAPARCAAQDARGSGPCAAFFGYAWNGSSCVGVSGCSCEGTACRALASSPDACRAAYAGCDCRAVGCPSGRRCSACASPGGVTYACIPDGAAC